MGRDVEDMRTIRIRASIRGFDMGEGWEDQFARYVDARWRVELAPYEEQGYDLDIDIDTRGGRSCVGIDEVSVIDAHGDIEPFSFKSLASELRTSLWDILNDPADLRRVDDHKDPTTLLLLAARSGSLESVGILLGRGADIHARDEHGRTPLYYAAERGKSDICAMLLRHGAEVESVDNEGASALMMAIGSYPNGAAAVRTLLEAGADPRRPDRDGDRALDIAKVRGDKEVVAMLTDKAQELDLLDRATTRSARPAREAEAAL